MMYTCSSSWQLFNAASSEGNNSAPGQSTAGLDVRTTFRRLGNAPFGSDSNVLRPMMMVFPVVSALKRFKSLGNQNKSLFSKPIALCRSMAAIIDIFILSNSYLSGDVRMRVVINQFKVLKLKVKDALHIWVDTHLRQGTRLAA